MRAISAFSLLAGMSTRVCLAVTPLRMRVIMSEIGSVISTLSKTPRPWALGFGLLAMPKAKSRKSKAFLPGALRHARDIALERQLAEAEAAHRELAHVGAMTAAQPATVPQPDLEL